jgi:AcrR family transcriptional regulator
MVTSACQSQAHRDAFCLLLVKPESNVRKRKALKMAKRQDRRVQRTQQSVRRALFELIQERGFEAISVQDIIDRANVGRATFYTHFQSKDDLLVSGFEDLRASLKARQRLALVQGRGVDERALAFSHEMFAHADEHRTLFRAMVGKRSGAVVQRMIHTLLLDLVRDDVKALARNEDTTSVPTEALVQFVAGSFFGLLMWWLNGKMRLSVEEVNGLFRRLALAALKAGPELHAAANVTDRPGRGAGRSSHS